MLQRAGFRVPSLATLACVLLFAGCGSGDPVEREESGVRTAIADYLRERRGINPDSMQMELSELQIDGDQAHARVTFRTAEMPDGLTFEYELVRNEGAWEVAASSARDGHGGAGSQLPEGHPPLKPEAPSGSETEDS